MLTEEMKKSIEEIVKSAMAATVTTIPETPTTTVIENAAVEPKKEDKIVKSLEDLQKEGLITETELSLIQAFRAGELEEVKEEEVTKSMKPTETQEDIKKSINEAINAQLQPLQKSIQEKDALIKSMQEKIEKIEKTPAYDKKSIDGLDVIEKGNKEEKKEENFSKAQILDVMFDLQKSKVVRPNHIAEFESTGDVSNKAVKQEIYNALKAKAK